MNYHLKGLKTFNGRDGGGYEATLFLDKKKVAHVMNEGNGGEDFYRFFSREDEKSFEDFASTWYETSDAKKNWEKWIVESSCDLNTSAQFKMECWISTAITTAENEKRLKRLSKAKTLFRLKGDEDGVWRTIGQVGQRVVDHIVKKHGEQLEQIYGAQVPSVLGAATMAPGALSF